MSTDNGLGSGRLEVDGRAEAHAQQRPAAGGVGGLGEPAAGLGGLADDGQAEARARELAGLLGAVEAVEDEGKVGGVEAGAVIADAQHAPAERDLDRSGGWAPAAGV